MIKTENSPKLPKFPRKIPKNLRSSADGGGVLPIFSMTGGFWLAPLLAMPDYMIDYIIDQAYQ